MTLESVWAKVITETIRRERMRSDEEHNTDSVQLKNVPHEAGIDDVQKWLMEGGIFVVLENIIPDMEEDRWIVENQSKDDLEKILSLTRKEMEVGERTRRVFISPITQSTPMKEKRREMKEYQLHQMKNLGTVPPPAVSTEESTPPVSMASTGAIPTMSGTGRGVQFFHQNRGESGDPKKELETSKIRRRRKKNKLRKSPEEKEIKFLWKKRKKKVKILKERKKKVKIRGKQEKKMLW